MIFFSKLYFILALPIRIFGKISQRPTEISITKTIFSTIFDVPHTRLSAPRMSLRSDVSPATSFANDWRRSGRPRAHNRLHTRARDGGPSLDLCVRRCSIERRRRCPTAAEPAGYPFFQTPPPNQTQTFLAYARIFDPSPGKPCSLTPFFARLGVFHHYSCTRGGYGISYCEEKNFD